MRTFYGVLRGRGKVYWESRITLHGDSSRNKKFTVLYGNIALQAEVSERGGGFEPSLQSANNPLPSSFLPRNMQ